MNERRIHQIFEISVLLKGAHALIECIGGLILAFVSTSAITSLVKAFLWRSAPAFLPSGAPVSEGHRILMGIMASGSAPARGGQMHVGGSQSANHVHVGRAGPGASALPKLGYFSGGGMADE